jgi:hypothetical protein
VSELLPALSAALQVMVAATALAAGGNIGWGACGPSGPREKSFACDTNAGRDTFVVSFVSPSDEAQVMGVECRVRVRTTDFLAPLPYWWQLQSGGCRSGSVGIEFTAGASSSCQQIPATIQGWNYSPIQVPGQAQLTVLAGPGGSGVSISSGVEYFVFRAIIDHGKTASPDSCGECWRPMTLQLEYVYLDETSRRVELTSPDRQGTITWQSGVVSAIPRSWGQIKSLFR